MTTDAWGIEDGYWDVGGTWHDATPDTVAALRRSMGGAGGDEAPPPSPPVWFVRHGDAPALHGPADLRLEDGTDVRADRALPPDLPLGYHDLRPADGGPVTRLIVTPARCHLPPDLRAWGWTVQLYAARSTRSWGIGDLADLRRLATWSRDAGAGMLTVNPLHASLPIPRQEPSPYFPSSRRYRNPLYLAIAEVPGADCDPVVEALAVEGVDLNRERIIDRDRVWALKMRALEHLFDRFPGDAAFDRWVTEEGAPLRQYATFGALAEHHGTSWFDWPEEHRHPDAPAVAAFAAARPDRLRFHCWLQWLLDRQLCEAGAEVPLITDLAVGVDPGGADGWAWQDVLAPGVRVGAPPDEFNTAGQDWGLPPFVPWKLRAAGYDPFVQTIRSAFSHTGGLRIDHVMGLFRLYWIPDGASPDAGAYVRYPGTELLDIVALESVRAGAFCVGEDLGTVEPEIRGHLAQAGVLSYRLVWFEPGPPEDFPNQALAAVTTHDLPTVAGLWTGADLEAQRRIGHDPNEEGTAALHRKIEDLLGVGPDEPVGPVVEGIYRRLARAPSMLVSATLDDALGVEERPNMPGTTEQWPNWSIALPSPLEDALDDPRVTSVADALRSGR